MWQYVFAYNRHSNSFSILLKFVLIGGKLFYHFVLVSAIQPCKLANNYIYVYICISLASGASLPSFNSFSFRMEKL